jgi:1-acyl-sn-glycerol-3-phosphate acyltransferase
VTLQIVGLVAAVLVCLPAKAARRETSEPVEGAALGSWPIRAYRLSLAAVLAVLVAGMGVCLSYHNTFFWGESVRHFDLTRTTPDLMLLGAALGCWLAGRQPHPRRALSLVPLGLTGMSFCLLWMYFSPSPWAWTGLGLMVGWVVVPLRAAYQCALPEEARSSGMALLVFTAGLLTLLLVACLSVVSLPETKSSLLAIYGFFITLSAAGAALAWWVLLREFLEQALEILLWPLYRIRAHGPGMHQFPLRGPVLVLANHAAYMDPFWLAKYVPRRVIPMMTSRYFDKPIIHWLMTRLVHGIRVQETTYRREAPELQEAIAALDRGECVFLFPEGAVRRKEEVLLRPFGQGVWRILEARPQTPVVVCWIEGNWGSFFSYFNGPPMRNKRLDWWRRIDIVFTEPRVLSADVLADQRATRTSLWRACLEARGILGLPVPTQPEPDGEAPEKSV